MAAGGRLRGKVAVVTRSDAAREPVREIEGDALA